MNDFSDYSKIIEEFIALFDHLIPIEQEKLDAAVKNQVTFIEDCMHKEQAAVLQLRGLEQKRESEQKRLGMEGYTFRQILEHAPEEAVVLLSPLFDQLAERVRSFRSVSDSARDIIGKSSCNTISSCRGKFRREYLFCFRQKRRQH